MVGAAQVDSSAHKTVPKSFTSCHCVAGAHDCFSNKQRCSGSRMSKNYFLQPQSAHQEACLMLRDPEMRKNISSCEGTGEIPT